MDSNCTSFSRRSFITGIAGLAAIGTLATVVPNYAFADTAAEKQAEADAAYASLVDMQQQLDIASNNYTEALFALEDAQKRMDECQQQIDQKTVEIEGLQDTLASRARAMYRTGGNYFLEVVVESTTFEEFANNMDLLDDINENDAVLIAQTKAARDDLEVAKVEYAAQEQAAQQAADEAARITAEAEATVAEMQSIYDSLSAEAAELLEAERKAAEEEAARHAAAVVAASAANGGEYRESAESQAHREANANTDEASSESEAKGEEEDATVEDSHVENPDTEEPDVGSEGESESDVEAESVEEDDVVEEDDYSEEDEYVEEDYSDDSSSSEESSGATYEGGSDTVSRAYACLGAPYSWGAVGPESYDCSGLVSYCLTGNHARIGTTGTFMGWSQVSDPQPGDICTSSYHCGVYIGDGQMIHAADYGIGVIVGPVQSDMIIVRW